MNITEIDPKDAAEKVLELGRDKAAEYFGQNKSTFRDYLYRNNLPTKKAAKGESKPGLSIKDGHTAEVTSEASIDISDPEKIVIDRGLNPDEWEFNGLVVNEWDSPTGETLKQLKVQLKRKNPVDIVEPARIDGPRRKGKDKSKVNLGSVVVVGDNHAPFFDPEMHDSIINLLGEIRPEKAVHIGDLVDFPDISRHRNNPAWQATAQECINSGYEVLRDYVDASPGTEWSLLHGNHEDRLRNTIIDHVSELYGLRQADNGTEVFSLKHLLRLDELDIEDVADDNTYEYAKIKLNEHIGAVHGHLAVKGSGNTARKLLDHYGHSVLCGHTHRQGEVYQTVRDINDEPEILTAVEIGCTCLIKKGIGYAPQSDWQQGLAVVNLYENGLFNVELATFINGNLLFRNEAI